MTLDTLRPFKETQHGYETVSRNGEHTYVITFNGIDYDVTHYWVFNPVGELIATATSTPSSAAREHYAKLQS